MSLGLRAVRFGGHAWKQEGDWCQLEREGEGLGGGKRRESASKSDMQLGLLKSFNTEGWPPLSSPPMHMCIRKEASKRQTQWYIHTHAHNSFFLTLAPPACSHTSTPTFTTRSPSSSYSTKSTVVIRKWLSMRASTRSTPGTSCAALTSESGLGCQPVSATPWGASTEAARSTKRAGASVLPGCLLLLPLLLLPGCCCA